MSLPVEKGRLFAPVREGALFAAALPGPSATFHTPRRQSQHARVRVQTPVAPCNTLDASPGGSTTAQSPVSITLQH
jgi:hypothetical protein